MNETLRQDALERLEWKKIIAFLADCAVFESTKHRLATLEPNLPPDERTYLFGATGETRKLEAQGIGPSLEPVEFASFVGPLQRGSVLSGVGLWNLRVALGLAERACAFAREQRRHPAGSSFPAILELLGSVEAQPKLHARLGQSVDAEGSILSTASPELRAARTKLEAARKRMVDSLESLLRRASVRDALQDSVWMQRDGRYVLPVRTDRKGEVPGVPRGVSQSGSTVFVEPTELGAAQTQIELAETEVQVEEARVLRELSEAAHAVRDPVLAALGALEIYDGLRARARFATTLDAVEPKFHADRPGRGAFSYLDARHPLFLLEGKPCVPNDLVLEANVWVLSGPNAGGKTVAMKTAGVLTLMALAGLFVPASDASLFGFTEVYAEMGDRQNLSDDLSTFSGHLVQLRAVLDGATPRTLVLLDEGFVGTDPTVGVAMARATLENLAAREATVLVTTHFSGLKALAEGDGRFQNGSMEFEPRQLKPTYRLRNGIPGQSYALELATRLGFPESILEAARSYVGEEMMRVERLVADLSRQKEELESQLEEQSRMSTAMGAELAALESDRKALGHARDTMVEGFREKLRKRLNAFENRLEIRERQFEKAKRDALRDMEERVEEPRPPVAKETTQPAEAHSASKAPRAPAAPSRTAPKSSPPSAAPSAAPSTAPAVRVTLTGFDALKGVTLSNARGKGSSASGSPATRVSPTDELVARARRPDKLTPRDLLDEARASLGRLEKSFDGIEERFHDDIDALGDLEDEAESARATGKTARERLKAREKEEAAKMGASGHPATFWRPGMRVRTQRLRDAGEVLRAVDAKGLVECKFGLVKMKLPHADLFTVEDVAKGLMAKGGSAKGSLPARPAPARALPPTKGAAPHREGGGSAGNRDMGIEPTFQHKGNTLDVRGQLVDSALEKVEAFLDRALREGQSTIIIIHGHGTGRVKQGVRELLQETRFELAWRPGTAGEGSDGVTVVKLA